MANYRGEQIAGFLERRGRRIVECSGILWHEAENRFLLPLPYQDTFDVEPGAITAALVRHGFAGARIPTREGGGLSGGVYVRRRDEYSINTVDRRQRSRVRRGLERCEMRAVDPDVLLRQGFEMNLGTMQRQGRFDVEFGSEKPWKQFVRAVEHSPGVKALGAFVDGRLGAYCVACRDDGWLHILHQNSSLDLLDCHPNHALTYSFTEEAMRDATLAGVCYGLMSVQPNPGLHEYKERFGYTLVPHVESYRLNPLIAPLLASSAALRVARTLAERKPESPLRQRIALVIEGAWRSQRSMAPHMGAPPLAQSGGAA
jgi:hypothetical protein